jgi:hypothetical protein
MKFGDKKQNNVVVFTGNRKTDILACFDKLNEDIEEKRILALKEKQREINEAAKKRF